MHDREPTIRSRELGRRIRQSIADAELSGKIVAERLDWAQSTVSRLLAGKHYANEVDVAAVLAVCGVTGRTRSQLLRLARDAYQVGVRVPKRLGSYTDYCAEAGWVTEFQSSVVPEILQIDSYARAQFQAAGRPNHTAVEQAVAARLGRAELFDREEPPRFKFFLHEWLLRTPVGGRDTMSDQLHHLLCVSVLPCVTLRIVPTSAGAHAAQSGAFGFLEFQHYRPVVHRPEDDADVYLEEPEEILTYRDILTRLNAVALNQHQSRAKIAEVVTTLWA